MKLVVVDFEKFEEHHFKEKVNFLSRNFNFQLELKEGYLIIATQENSLYIFDLATKERLFIRSYEKLESYFYEKGKLVIIKDGKLEAHEYEVGHSIPNNLHKNHLPKENKINFKPISVSLFPRYLYDPPSKTSEDTSHIYRPNFKKY